MNIKRLAVAFREESAGPAFGAGVSAKKGRVVICTPTVSRVIDGVKQPLPFMPFRDSLAASAPALTAAGWNEGMVLEIDNAYISVARAVMLRKALNTFADIIVFIDHDLSWRPDALLRLIETPGDVVAGTYRYKTDEEEKYMGWLAIEDHAIQQREDGCFKATHVPAGFLKITRNAVNRFMEAYPELVYGERCLPHVDLFNHGAIEGIWFGEDFAFSRRWTEMGGDIWLVPDLDLTHHAIGKDGSLLSYPGNFAGFIARKGFKVHHTKEKSC